ncbi:hypothetical protein BV22DRAFT_201111 [Leucogyrophana mollusca]|uniref:Uncharacterized protein n=1 Tax=Leucogyrophana mollusca TaxID=85980 RepID=A0ACB8BTM7_9AGAM|nr:hypothetical protein BV22DRAFT_201111 [Leucogyrophana mollusca]
MSTEKRPAMAIRRSNTAPYTLDEHNIKRAELTRAKSTLDEFPRLQVQPSTTPSWYGLSTAHLTRTAASRSSPLATPHEREDPFNLAGFFPVSHFASPTTEAERWEWLRHEENRSGPTRDELGSVCSFSEDEVDGSLPTTPGPVVFARLEEDEAEEAIKGEDKMGILSLNAIFLARDTQPTEDKLYSPYAEGEAVDQDSLYLALSARRHAETASPSPCGSVGELFLQAEQEDGDEGWLGWVLRGIGSLLGAV